MVVLRRFLDLEHDLNEGIEAVLLLVLPILARVEGELEDAVFLDLRAGQEQAIVASVGIRLAVTLQDTRSASAREADGETPLEYAPACYMAEASLAELIHSELDVGARLACRRVQHCTSKPKEASCECQ